MGKKIEMGTFNQEEVTAMKGVGILVTVVIATMGQT